MATKAQMKQMKKDIASQMGVGHQNQEKGKTRATPQRHMNAAKGPIMPENSGKGSVKGGGKAKVKAMKTAKKMHKKGTLATAPNKMHSKNKKRTSKTKQNYGKTY